VPDQHDAHFDLIVIGGGPSGSIVAEGCAAAGLQVALIERDQLGGTCLNYGCDPTNVLIRAGELSSLARRARTLGVHVDGITVDWLTLRSYITGMIDEVRDGDGVASLREKGIRVYKEHARFLSPHVIQAGDETLATDRVVIAAGSMPVVPSVPGLERAGYLTHRDVFALDSLPRSIAVIGGGPHALEFAQAYASLGVEVAVLTTGTGILPEEDEEIVAELTRLLRQDGLAVHTGVGDLRASLDESGEKRLGFTDENGGGSEIGVDAILVASGRMPALEGLGLEAAQVQHSPAGIVVDAHLRTSAEQVWAVGDVTGIGSHTHVADYQAQVALHNILHPDAPKEADYWVVPWKVFTQPEIGRVGLTESGARAAGHDVLASSMPYRDLPRAVTLNEREGLVKLVVDRASHEVLGGHILGAYASEAIAQVALVMQHRLPVTAIRETLHVHPTMGEGVYWVADAIREKLLQDPAPAP
jgi:pyruvate/2-oxoglutarate dehydrogenase complex dihydrolipoamide dehydrogenase (E3) component